MNTGIVLENPDVQSRRDTSGPAVVSAHIKLIKGTERF